jgi:hypothetical protein
MLDWRDFRTKYVLGNYPEEFDSRTEYLKYFQKTYPLEYIKYRDHLNHTRHKREESYSPEKREEQRLKRNARMRQYYQENKPWYQEYYREYIKDPVNRKKNTIRAREWYYKNKKPKISKEKQVKSVKNKKVKQTLINDKSNERKSALTTKKFENAITIDFS